MKKTMEKKRKKKIEEPEVLTADNLLDESSGSGSGSGSDSEDSDIVVYDENNVGISKEEIEQINELKKGKKDTKKKKKRNTFK